MRKVFGNSFWRGRGRLFVFSCGLLGALVFFAVYGPYTLNTGNTHWLLLGMPEGDILQHYSGWLAFKNAPLSFPLTYTALQCWPSGTVAAFTDSIPLASLALKPFAAFFPDAFQFFGWYVLVCYVLQGVFAGLLLRLFSENAVFLYAGVLLFTLSPVMMERAFRHVALTSHFIVMGALYFYAAMRSEGFCRLRGQFFLFNVLAIGIHPYFVPMVMAITLAAVLEYMLRRKSWIKPLVFLGGNIAAALFAGWLIGSVGWGAAAERTGYGEYSLNLNALFNPSGLGGFTWSRFLKAQPQLPNQYDGFHYLGLGMLLLLLGVVSHWLVCCAAEGGFWRTAARRAASFIRRRAVLLAVCLCLTAFAVSNVAALGGKVLFALPLPGFVLGAANIFRAGGRMFTPVYYLLMLFALRYLAVHFKPRPGAVLALLAFFVQLADLSGVIAEKHSYYRAPPAYETPAENAKLQKAMEGCGYVLTAGGGVVDQQMAVLAAQNGISTNMVTAAAGRYAEARRLGDETRELLLQGQSEPGVFYIVFGAADTAAVTAAFEGSSAVTLYRLGEEWLYLWPANG